MKVNLFSNTTSRRYLTKADIPRDTRATIAGVRLAEMPNGDRKPVIAFRESHKELVAGDTVLRVLCSAFGDETDAWIGRQIVLYVDPTVKYQGTVVGGLRVRTTASNDEVPY